MYLPITAIVVLLLLAVLAVFLSPRRLKRTTPQEKMETPTFLSVNTSFPIIVFHRGSFLTALLFFAASFLFLALAAYLFWAGFSEYMQQPSNTKSLWVIACVALLPFVLGFLGVVFGVREITSYISCTIDNQRVQVEKRVFFRTKRWCEPLDSYKGLQLTLLYVRHWGGLFGFFELRLIHPVDQFSVCLGRYPPEQSMPIDGCVIEHFGVLLDKYVGHLGVASLGVEKRQKVFVWAY